MELNYIVNRPAVSQVPPVNSALGLASQLPFLSRNYIPYSRGIIKNFEEVTIDGVALGNTADVHYCVMCPVDTDKIRIYTNINGYGTVCLEASSPDGPWSLLMDDANPKKICTLPNEWDAAAGYDQTWGLWLASIVYNQANHATDGYFRGWFTAKKDGKYCTAFGKSQDGDDWSGYTLCTYDERTTELTSSYRFLMGAYFDQVAQKYYGICSGTIASKGRAQPVFVVSDDGIAWRFVSLLPFIYNNAETVEFQATSLAKIGNLFVAGISRYDYTEGRQVKNPVWCYSADEGATWYVWNEPFINTSAGMLKYPAVYCTPNYIYLPYIHKGRYMCMARMDWSSNPPVTAKQDDITVQNTPSAGFYANQIGGKKIVVTIDVTASASSAGLSFNVHPIVAYGSRVDNVDFARGGAMLTEAIELRAGRNIVSFAVENLPYLWNFSLESTSSGVTLSDITVSYIRYE